MKFKDSQLAHELLDNSNIIVEVGASAHNPFNIICNEYYNVDLPKHYRSVYEKESEQLGEGIAEVHIEITGTELPFPNESVNAVISSHVIEHFFNPVKALQEWYRIIKPGGYLYIICPHKDRTFDKDREVTTIPEIIQRLDVDHIEDGAEHYTVWRTEDFVNFVKAFGYIVTHVQDVDDKVGNGFTVVIQKPE